MKCTTAKHDMNRRAAVVQRALRFGDGNVYGSGHLSRELLASRPLPAGTAIAWAQHMESNVHASAVHPDLGSMRPNLLKLARRVADRINAEDFVQEALTRALERRESLRPDTNLSAWMRPVIRNLAIDEGRKRMRDRPLEEACTPSVGPTAAPVWSSFDASDVRRALTSCSDELRTTFELHYWAELSLDAIAAQLRVPRATVGTRLFRARAQVRRALEREMTAQDCR